MESWGGGDQLVTPCKGMVRDDGKRHKTETKPGLAEAELLPGWIGS